MTNDRIGVVGLGRMGSAVLQRLQAQGRPAAIAWDRDPARTARASGFGARAARDRADLATGADAILSFINDDAGAGALYDGDSGLLAHARPGTLFIEMSTLRPATVARLAAEAEARGCGLVGAPVMGTWNAVLDGKLLVLAGGKPAHVQRAERVLQPLARRVVAFDAAGRGNAMKLVVNLGMAACLQALAEGLALGERQGLPLPLMLEILHEAPTASPLLRVKQPVLLGDTGDISLDIVSLRKDVLSALAVGAGDGVPMPMAASLSAVLSAAVACGGGALDLAELPKLYRTQLLQRDA